MVEPAVRVVGVFSTPTGDLSIFRFLAEREDLDLTVLYAHEDRSGRGGAGRAPFDHRILPGRTLARNHQTAVEQVWNQGFTRTLDALRPEVLFVGGYGTVTGIRAIRWAGRRRVPWVLYSESWGLERGPRSRRWAKERVLPTILRGGAGFVTYGRSGEEYLRHHGARGPIATIGSNRDLVAIAEAVDRARATAPAGEGQHAFAFIGRLVEAKGVDVLLQAFAEVSPDLPGWTLIVAGDGPLRSEVERAAAVVPVEALGSVPFERIHEVLARAGVLVLPSRTEPWGQVVPEAMAAGVPVLSSGAVGAAHHFIEPGRTGWIVPPGDRRALAEGLSEAAAADLVAAGAAARQRALRDDVREAARSVGDLLVRAARPVG